MILKSLKLLALWLVVFAVSAAAFTPQFADANKQIRLRWKNPFIRIALSNSLKKQTENFTLGTDVEGAINRSLETWQRVADIKFQTVWTDKETVSPAGNAGDGVSLITIAKTNENLALFGADWNDMSAQTRTFFNRRGLITEADIVLNPFQRFSTDGIDGYFDLEATLTHEIGHLLGLEHSFVMGATMYAHQAKNGVYQLPAFSPRTLSEDDITGIRALYGAKSDDENCCGSISGKIFLSNGKAAKEYQVWAEESESGRVVSGVLSGLNGEFLFEGLTGGKYRIYAQRADAEAVNSFSAEEIGTAEVENGESVELTKKLQSKPTAFNLQFTGFLGQISELAVPVNSGKSYTIFIGGKNLDPDLLEINFNSPNISVVPNSLRKEYDYGAGISVVSVDVRIGKNTPLGEYGIFVGLRGDRAACLAGSLTVEEFENKYGSIFFDR